MEPGASGGPRGSFLPTGPERHQNDPPLLHLYQGSDDFGAQGLRRPSGGQERKSGKLGFFAKPHFDGCHFSIGKVHIPPCDTPLHMKKIEEPMTKVNGKPYLRTKIALRVIVWWPFCDFFKKNLIPALVKVTIGQKRKRKDMREKV